MSKKIYRTAIIGLGAVGKRMLTNLFSHPRFEPVVGYDLSSKSLNNFELPDGSFKFLDDITDLYETRGIDLLYISTPPKFHAGAVYEGLKNKWNILCEKPLGISLSDSTQLVRTIEQYEVFQGVNFVFSGAPSMHAAKKQLAAGVIGDLKGAEFIMKFANWPRPWQAHAAWLGEREQGGMLREVGSHYAYLSQEIFGKLKPSPSQIIEFPQKGLAETLFMGRWESSYGSITLNARVGGHRQDMVRYRILGSEGCLVFDNWYQLYLEKPDGWTPLLDSESSQPIRAYMGQLDQLALQLDDGQKRLASFSDALAVQELIEGTFQ